jgi:catechol 2,3-dioxygenase-like lactoylglutathione lyase family enzyme
MRESSPGGLYGTLSRRRPLRPEVFPYEIPLVQHVVGGGIMLGSVRHDGNPACVAQPGAFSAYVVTDEPDGLHARVVAAGAEIVTGLHETDYGSRDFAVRDPEGNRWSFGTYPGAPRFQQATADSDS